MRDEIASRDSLRHPASAGHEMTTMRAIIAQRPRCRCRWALPGRHALPPRRGERRHRPGACGGIHSWRTRLAGHVDRPGRARPGTDHSRPRGRRRGRRVGLRHNRTVRRSKSLRDHRLVLATARWPNSWRWRRATSCRCRMASTRFAAAALPISGLTAWQGLFTHGRSQGRADRSDSRRRGRRRFDCRAAGARGRGSGDRHRPRGAPSDRARSGRGCLRRPASHDRLEDIGEMDVVFDVIGGEILQRSAALVRPGGTLVSIAEPPRVPPDNGRAVFFVVEPDRNGTCRTGGQAS